MTIARRPIAERVISSTTALSTNHPATWTADPDTNVLTSSAAHGLTVNTPIAFGAGTGALPGGLSPEPEYYWVVSVPTTTTLTVSLTYGGAAVDITSAGMAGWVVKMLAPCGYSTSALFSRIANMSLRDLGAIDITLTQSVCRAAAGFYTALLFGPTTTNVYASSAYAAFAQGGYRAYLAIDTFLSKKYNRTIQRLRLEMVDSTTAAGHMMFSAVSADDAAFTSGLAYANKPIAFHLNLGANDLTEVAFFDGYANGRVLPGATFQVTAAAR